MASCTLNCARSLTPAALNAGPQEVVADVGSYINHSAAALHIVAKAHFYFFSKLTTAAARFKMRNFLTLLFATIVLFLAVVESRATSDTEALLKKLKKRIEVSDHSTLNYATKKIKFI